MSGFGNGFGSGFGGPPSMPSFGTPAPPLNPSPQQQQFGSGFGSSGGFNTVGGFGMTPGPSGSGTGFGNQQQQSGTSPFGGTNTGNTPFGSINNTPSFGTAPNQGFGAPGGFNTSPANVSNNTMTGFGSSIQTPFGTAAPTTFGQQPNTLFGSTAGGTSFGNTTGGSLFNSTTGGTTFGSATGGTPFGSATGGTPFGSAISATPFGSASGTPFGSTTGISSVSAGGFSAPQQTQAVPSPFGSSTAAPSSAISFGVSSNIAPTPVGQQQQGFGAAYNTPFSNSSPAFGNSTSTFGTSQSSASTTPTFGISTTNSFAPYGFGGGMQSDNDDEEDMMDGGDGFGASTVPPFGSNMAPSSTSWGQSFNGTRVPSPEPTSSGIQDSSMSPTPVGTSKEDELAQLKAKKAEILRKKKKKLEELMRRKEASSASSTLNASAPSFVPSDHGTDRSNEASSVLANRNAARFAKPDTDDSLLPEELRNRQGPVASGYKDGGPEEQHDIENAVSLVGTCSYMCPDDELIRRQKEGDIQLLETPKPGTIHPKDWTLRNTAVKRFRRSAADYKLNVPEWVRPPDVLETVCGYLEEWVMERDRQGPDPRFPNVEHPPSLDVYQFIWDRTRMVRKDFILQNYVGTGGNCDARAVRCHERIARWHAMCEHQLSHIPEFVSAQSQQNIQEFGQAMKTLNMYYDDSLGRSIVEVPDENGNETRMDLAGTTHGCTSQLVMGANPVDFDGKPLNNDVSSIHVERRLTGPQAANSPCHGTAEPEMRGLYILTTMDNDGGMEVLKYASSLHSKRPEVYNSKPVQLAMRIFKAKKEHNYARFFSILRDPETPYLFACIMFKHVEQMRKYAFRIMSRTYGGIAKKTKQAMEDQYPLKRLVRLLCFEDEDEALKACRHYNITVEESPATNPASPSTSSQAIVYWRRSSYREPKDPEKGFTLSLKPRKMIRTIESKLNGATRLAVCRGEVSGEGAALSSIPVSPSSRRSPAGETVVASFPSSVEQSETQQQELEEQAAKRRMEERRRLKEAQKREEEEKRKIEEMKRKQKEEEERQALLLQKQREEEAKRKQAEEEAMKRKQAEDERRRKLESEEARRAAEAAAREEQLRREAEARRQAAEAAAREEQLHREAAEKLRQEELRRKREEEEQILLQELEKKRLEMERIRHEEEMRRQEQLRLKREREEQERLRREEEARRIAAEKEAKMNQARKLLMWRRLRSKLDRELRKERTRQTLLRLDPTSTSNEAALINLRLVATNLTDAASLDDVVNDARANVLPGIYVLDSLSRQANPAINLSDMMRKALCAVPRSTLSLVGDVMLAKVAVVLPSFVGPKADAMQSLLHSWIGKRLQYGQVGIDLQGGNRHSFEIRSVASNGNGGNVDCDMALLVIPPFFGDESQDLYSVKFPDFNHTATRVILCLDDGTNHAFAQVVNALLSSVPQDVPLIQVGEEPRTDSFDLALEESCDALLQSFAASYSCRSTRGTLVRLSVEQLASRCIRSALWRDGTHRGTNEEHMVMDRARGVLVAMLAELSSISTVYRRSRWSNWPPSEFVDESGVVRNYFGDGLHLPIYWRNNLSHSELEPAVMELFKQLDGTSFRKFIARMTTYAPEQVLQDCRDMMAKRQFRRCLEYILLWRESTNEPSVDDAVVYLPKESVGDIIEGCVRRMGLDGDDLDFSFENIVSEEPAYIEESDENAFSVELMQAMRSPAVLLEECSPRKEIVDTPLAESSPPDSNIMSPPVGVETPASPPVGVETPATLPQSAEFLRGSTKRLLDSGEALRNTKRQKNSPLSKDEKDSISFTKKLEAMLHGETVTDIKVGNAKLADFLRNAPSIDLP